MCDTGINIAFEDEQGELLNWKVTDGSYVRSNAILLFYKIFDGEKKSLKSTIAGMVMVDKNLKRGTLLKRGTVVANISECTHAIVIKDMCASCGKDLREKFGLAGDRIEASSANVSMIHHVPELIVSDALAKKIGSRDRELLLKAHKLVLLVDLDQTIIHTTNHNFKNENGEDIFHYKLKGVDFYTKIRPYTRDFLRRMSELYEMHIISYGERQYAHQIAEFLDRERQYFGHRILSRDELLCAMYKSRNVNSLFPCGDHMIAIIDDRPDVWQYSDALIQVLPYRFFKEVGDINAPRSLNANMESSASCAEIDDDLDDDETLHYVAAILTKIHSSFYDLFDDTKLDRVPDLKGIIAYLRRQVLRGCSIVLSGIVPVGVEALKTEAYRLCIQFGADVSENVTDKTTHVIAARWGTSKVHDARKRPDISIVNPKWLFACVEKWEKADEKEFALLKDTMKSMGRPLGGSIISDEFSKLPTFGKEVLSRMANEVEQALSEGSSDQESDADADQSVTKNSVENVSGNVENFKRKMERNVQKNDASQMKKISCGVVEVDSSISSRSVSDNDGDDDDDDDDMVADVEKQFFS